MFSDFIFLSNFPPTALYLSTKHSMLLNQAAYLKKITQLTFIGQVVGRRLLYRERK